MNGLQERLWNNKVIGGILLVSGTAIGAGMLALPVSTGLAGFMPAMVLFLISWGLMLYTALLMLEVNLWMGEGDNLITMAKYTLGRWGEVISWITYLFLLYALTTAYIAGTGFVVSNIVHTMTGYTINNGVGALPFLLLCSLFVYSGIRAVDHINRILMMGLIVSYFVIAFGVAPHVELAPLKHTQWPAILLSVSIVFTSFGFHIIIPSLSSYLKHDVPKLKKTIIIGGSIPLITYVIWEVLVLGIIPVSGEVSLAQGHSEGIDGAQLLGAYLQKSWLGILVQAFSFFAIITSFLGVSLSLLDFLSDGLHINKTSAGRTILYALTFGPPLAFTLIDPRAFFSALEYAGAFGVIILLGLLPALMVWSGRYYHRFPSDKYRAPGGKIALTVVMVASLAVIAIEILIKLHVIK